MNKKENNEFLNKKTINFLINKDLFINESSQIIIKEIKFDFNV